MTERPREIAFWYNIYTKTATAVRQSSTKKRNDNLQAAKKVEDQQQISAEKIDKNTSKTPPDEPYQDFPVFQEQGKFRCSRTKLIRFPCSFELFRRKCALLFLFLSFLPGIGKLDSTNANLTIMPLLHKMLYIDLNYCRYG